jgi:hypothetical protein
MQNFQKFMDTKSKMTIKKNDSMGSYKRENKTNPLGATKITFICIYMKMNWKIQKSKKDKVFNKKMIKMSI